MNPIWQLIQSTSTKQPIPHNPSEFDFLKFDYNKIINNNDEDDDDVRIQQDRQWKYNVTCRRVHLTIVAVEKE